MGQLSIKLPDEEIEFLEWYTKKHASPKASTYRDVTIEHFRQWKQDVLLNDYMKGEISIKEFCNLAHVSFFRAMTLIEESGLEPLIPSIITEYTTELTEEHLKNQDLTIFKSKKPIKRKSPTVMPNNSSK